MILLEFFLHPWHSALSLIKFPFYPWTFPYAVHPSFSRGWLLLFSPLLAWRKKPLSKLVGLRVRSSALLKSTGSICGHPGSSTSWPASGNIIISWLSPLQAQRHELCWAEMFESRDNLKFNSQSKWRGERGITFLEHICQIFLIVLWQLLITTHQFFYNTQIRTTVWDWIENLTSL
jgi:hypothetical protein